MLVLAARRSSHAHLCQSLAFPKSRGIWLTASQEEATGRNWEIEEDEEASGVLSLLRPAEAYPQTQRVRLDQAGRLIWPVMFLYPEHGQSDLIESFSEDDRCVHHVYVSEIFCYVTACGVGSSKIKPLRGGLVPASVVLLAGLSTTWK